MHKLVERTAKCVQVLSNVHIEKRQLGVLIVQQDANLLWSNCDPDVWSCLVVQKLIAMPENLMLIQQRFGNYRQAVCGVFYTDLIHTPMVFPFLVVSDYQVT